MRPHPQLPQLMMLLAGALLVASVLILIVYLLQKAFRPTSKAGDSERPKVALDDEAAFTMATVKGVISQLKTEQKSAQDELIAAERQAEQSARKLSLIAAEFDQGLMIFDGDGYITFANARMRKLLPIDTWSHRRFTEIFQDTPILSEIVGKCFELRTELRQEKFDLPGSDGGARRLEITALPSFDRSGAMDFVACIFREATSRDA